MTSVPSRLNKTGASISEMLVTVLIMSFVTLAIAAGVTAAVRVYHEISLKAEAQTLLGTSVAALNNDFAFADISSIEQGSSSGGEQISFFSNDRGYSLDIHNDANKGIMVTNDIPLVTGKTMTLDLHTKISGISYDQTGKYFTYKITVLSNENRVIEPETEIKVKNIAG